VADLRSHADNQAAATQHGWTLVHEEVSSVDEWDAFETGFLRRAEEAHAAAPDDEQARAKLEHWTGWHAAYRRWGRDTLGFGFYVLERPG